MPTEREILWSQTPTGSRLHAWLPHPLAPEYLWSACGQLAGAAVIGNLETNNALDKCKRCTGKAPGEHP